MPKGPNHTIEADAKGRAVSNIVLNRNSFPFSHAILPLCTAHCERWAHLGLEDG